MSKNLSIPSSSFLSHEIIERRIYLIRGKKVMFDRDLASLYDVETRILNQAITRNLDRFPEDFMFQLSKEEFKILQMQFGASGWGGVRKRPRVFTEHGILMLSSVLNSKRAIHVNIEIMRTFTKLREYILSHKDLQKKIMELESRYDAQFKVVFKTIRRIEEPLKAKRKKFIGFNTSSSQS